MPASSDSLIERRTSEASLLLRDAVYAGNERELTEMLRDLSSSSAAAVNGGLRATVRQRERLHRLHQRLVDDVSGRSLGDRLLSALEEADRILAAVRTRAVARAEHDARELRYQGVRAQVLALLAVPRRPRQIADALGCDPSEASRAIAELRERGQVIKVGAPLTAPADGRAHWFVQA